MPDQDPRPESGHTDHSASADRASQPLVQRAINRSLSSRYASAADDVSRIIDATYRVIERTGTVDPRMRDILAEAGLSTQAFYRHFASKDELLLVVLDDGLRRLSDYLQRRMSKVDPGLPQVRSWLEGVLAQATDDDAASRTRPFVINVYQLIAQYPHECQTSINMLLALLHQALRDAESEGQLGRHPTDADAGSIYHLAFGSMQLHIAMGTKPTPIEVSEMAAFVLRGLNSR